MRGELRGSEATERGEVWEGGASAGQGNFCIWSPKKQFRVHIFGQRLLEYDFLQIARGQTITSSFKHAVSDTFIIIISERAKRASASGTLFISMSQIIICQRLRRALILISQQVILATTSEATTKLPNFTRILFLKLNFVQTCYPDDFE